MEVVYNVQTKIKEMLKTFKTNEKVNCFMDIIRCEPTGKKHKSNTYS